MHLSFDLYLWISIGEFLRLETLLYPLLIRVRHEDVDELWECAR